MAHTSSSGAWATASPAMRREFDDVRSIVTSTPFRPEDAADGGDDDEGEKGEKAVSATEERFADSFPRVEPAATAKGRGGERKDAAWGPGMATNAAVVVGDDAARTAARAIADAPKGQCWLWRGFNLTVGLFM